MDQAVASLRDFLRTRPVTALVASNAVTAAVALWVISEGRPIHYVYKQLFRAALASVPASIMDAKMGEVRETVQKSVVGTAMEGEPAFPVLPSKGLSKDEILRLLEKWSATDRTRWQSGKISGAVYHGGEDITTLAGAAYQRYALSNPLHPDVFPSVRKMESEIVSQVLALFNASPTGCGTVTSGGTESILMAIKAYRDYARKTRGVVEPELVAPVTAHAAFDKACGYFGIKLRHLSVDQTTFRVRPEDVQRAINRNTIAVVVSSPCYAQGVMDPVPAVAAIALQHNIPCHVDCCLGSFVVAFAEAAGFKTPYLFDFRVPGVTSISVDTHKYGFAPKGTSVVMYSKPEYRHAQYFVAPEWTGGIYASPTIAGSRAGAMIAACWATLVFMGANGYTSAARTILTAARRIADGVRQITAAGGPIELYGEPDLSVVAFGVRRSGSAGGHFNMYALADAMSKRGWHLNTLQNPASIHICVTYANAPQAETFLADLNEAIAEVKAAGGGTGNEGAGAIYGLAASIPDKSLVNDVCNSFLDALYKVQP